MRSGWHDLLLATTPDPGDRTLLRVVLAEVEEVDEFGEPQRRSCILNFWLHDMRGQPISWAHDEPLFDLLRKANESEGKAGEPEGMVQR